MSQIPNATIGIDIGKNSFHAVGLDQRGANRAAAEVVAWPGGTACADMIFGKDRWAAAFREAAQRLQRVIRVMGRGCRCPLLLQQRLCRCIEEELLRDKTKRRIRDRFDSRFGNKIAQNNVGRNAGMRRIVFLNCLVLSKRYALTEIPSTIVFKIETVRDFSFGLEPTAPTRNRSGVQLRTIHLRVLAV
jgi:hypothetical protein